MPQKFFKLEGGGAVENIVRDHNNIGKHGRKHQLHMIKRQTSPDLWRYDKETQRQSKETIQKTA